MTITRCIIILARGLRVNFLIGFRFYFSLFVSLIIKKTYLYRAVN